MRIPTHSRTNKTMPSLLGILQHSIGPLLGYEFNNYRGLPVLLSKCSLFSGQHTALGRSTLRVAVNAAVFVSKKLPHHFKSLRSPYERLLREPAI
jgi:hypothetical protein